ncbi:MAG TPA: EF-hand domain-containing protein [Kofleriaceae bacterium]
MLTKLKLALFIAAPLVAGATTYAFAQSGVDSSGGIKPDVIQKFDQNGDGVLDDAERAQMKAAFAARRAEHKKQMLAKFDANHDGVLDDAERAQMKAAFAARRDAKLTERFQAMDKNGDGQLSLGEFKAGAGAAHHRHGRRGPGFRHRAGART